MCSLPGLFLATCVLRAAPAPFGKGIVYAFDEDSLLLTSFWLLCKDMSKSWTDSMQLKHFCIFVVRPLTWGSAQRSSHKPSFSLVTWINIGLAHCFSQIALLYYTSCNDSHVRRIWSASRSPHSCKRAPQGTGLRSWQRKTLIHLAPVAFRPDWLPFYQGKLIFQHFVLALMHFSFSTCCHGREIIMIVSLHYMLAELCLLLGTMTL